MFEYQVVFYPVEYIIQEHTTLISDMPSVPIPESIYESKLLQDHMNLMGGEGWELITVTPLLRGVFHPGQHYGYSLTSGYYYYWKREKMR